LRERVRRMAKRLLVWHKGLATLPAQSFTQVHKCAAAYNAARPRIRLSDCGLTPT
jgi:hypothetical protein